MFVRVGPTTPCEEDTCLSLLQSSRDSQTLHPRCEVLVSNLCVPLCESMSYLEISRLRAKSVKHFEPIDATSDIVLPHIKSQFEFSVPESCHFPTDSVQLGQLLLFESLIKHPRFKLSVENEALSMALSIELWNLPIQLHQHHRIASKFEPTN